jgi:hypothetical protein
VRAWIEEERAFFTDLLPVLLALRVALYAAVFVVDRARGEHGAGWELFRHEWSSWDAERYLRLASDGYALRSVDNNADFAFLPVFPYTLRALHAALPALGVFALGIGVANAASLAAFLLLHRLARQALGDEAALRTVLYAATFPAAYFSQAVYTEGPFLLVAVATFYFLHSGRIGPAALCAAIGSGMRVPGALLGLCVAVELVARRRDRLGWQALWLLATPLGLAWYAAINRAFFGDPFFFLKLQHTVWEHTWAPPWEGAREVVRALTAPARTFDWRVVDVSQMVGAEIGLVTAVLATIRLPARYAVYVWGSLAMWVCNTRWMSLPRFAFVLFPAFLLLGSVRGPRGVHAAVWVTSFALAIALAAGFVRGAPFY